MKRHLPALVTVAFLALVFLAGYGAMYAADAQGRDDVPGPGIAAAPLYDGGLADPVPAVAPTPPDPESDLVAFVRIVVQVGKTSIPAAAVFVAFAIVTVVRRRWPPATQGTTGILTATLLTALTYAVSMLATGAPVGQALGGAVIALLTGRAMAMQPAARP